MKKELSQTVNPLQMEHKRMELDQILQTIRVLSELLYSETQYGTGIINNRLGLNIGETNIIKNKLIQQINKL